jgi:hypothetical protein
MTPGNQTARREHVLHKCRERLGHGISRAIVSTVPQLLRFQKVTVKVHWNLVRIREVLAKGCNYRGVFGKSEGAW